MNIAYVILHKMGKFGLAISEWNFMITVQRTWVRFKYYFCTAHQELQETPDLTVDNAGMQHANTSRDVVSGLEEVLQQEQVLTENTVSN